MAIRVKAIERNVAFAKGEEKRAYVLQADLYNKPQPLRRYGFVGNRNNR